jgi:hypothetical protein
MQTSQNGQDPSAGGLQAGIDIGSVSVNSVVINAAKQIIYESPYRHHMTVGLWRVVGTPTEYAFSGTDMLVRVTYDRNDRVPSNIFKAQSKAANAVGGPAA